MYASAPVSFVTPLQASRCNLNELAAEKPKSRCPLSEHRRVTFEISQKLLRNQNHPQNPTEGYSACLQQIAITRQKQRGLVSAGCLAHGASASWHVGWPKEVNGSGPMVVHNVKYFVSQRHRFSGARLNCVIGQAIISLSYTSMTRRPSIMMTQNSCWLTNPAI